MNNTVDDLGYICLWRKMIENPIWTSEPFTRGQAWVDLLMMANHKDSYFYVRGNRIDIKRGQVGRSQKYLSERWTWSRTKVNRFLNDLEKEQQIKQQKSNVINTIEIVNYDLYQKKSSRLDNRKAAEKQQKSTYNNDKNNNNIYNTNTTPRARAEFDSIDKIENLDVEKINQLQEKFPNVCVESELENLVNYCRAGRDGKPIEYADYYAALVRFCQKEEERHENINNRTSKQNAGGYRFSPRELQEDPTGDSGHNGRQRYKRGISTHEKTLETGFQEIERLQRIIDGSEAEQEQGTLVSSGHNESNEKPNHDLVNGVKNLWAVN